MKTIDIIHDEHRALAAVLQGLGFVVKGIREARFAPDFRLLTAMIDYITQVPEKVHHPKEDRFLFPRLRSRSPKAAAKPAKAPPTLADRLSGPPSLLTAKAPPSGGDDAWETF